MIDLSVDSQRYHVLFFPLSRIKHIQVWNIKLQAKKYTQRPTHTTLTHISTYAHAQAHGSAKLLTVALCLLINSFKIHGFMHIYWEATGFSESSMDFGVSQIGMKGLAHPLGQLLELLETVLLLNIILSALEMWLILPISIHYYY